MKWSILELSGTHTHRSQKDLGPLQITKASCCKTPDWAAVASLFVCLLIVANCREMHLILIVQTNFTTAPNLEGNFC